MDPPPLVPGKQQQRGESSHIKRSITNQQTWLEAWNWYASARIGYDPDIALSLMKYQTLMAMLFRQYTPKACIEYDRYIRPPQKVPALGPRATVVSTSASSSTGIDSRPQCR